MWKLPILNTFQNALRHKKWSYKDEKYKYKWMTEQKDIELKCELKSKLYIDKNRKRKSSQRQLLKWKNSKVIQKEEI